ncbi:glycosyltransferase, partial [bacterium]
MTLVSVVLPVFNEAALLPGALAALKAQAPEAELVVVDGGSADGTLEAARAGAHVLVKSPRRGRGFQMDLG